MAWIDINRRMHSNTTDGSEFNNGQKINDRPIIGHTNCDYCGKEVLCIWDDNNSNHWFPFLGNQARKPNVYKYSPIIQMMRKYFNVENKVWDEQHGNNLMNLHARCHCYPENWSKRAHPNGLAILCNSCFQKTYNRIKVKGDDGYEYALSVLPDETVEQVMKELDITGTVIGKGAINDYD